MYADPPQREKEGSQQLCICPTCTFGYIKQWAPRFQPYINPIYLNLDGSFPDDQPTFKKGTTVLAFTFEDGIMVAADHSSKSSAKNIVELNSHMLATISGGSEFLLQKLRTKCHEQEQKEGRKTSVAKALKWLADMLETHKEELSIEILIAVWNESEHGLYCINGKGEVVENSLLATGSGSSASVVLEYMCALPSHTHSYNLRRGYSPFSYRHSRKRVMSLTEAVVLAEHTTCFAASMAPQNGDTVSVYHLGNDGCKTVIEEDLEEWQKENLKYRWTKVKVIGKGW